MPIRDSAAVCLLGGSSSQAVQSLADHGEAHTGTPGIALLLPGFEGLDQENADTALSDHAPLRAALCIRSIQFSPIEASRPGAADRLARLATLQGDPELVGFEDNAAHGAIHFFGDNGRGIFLSHVLEISDILASPSFAHRNSFIERETNREKMESS